MDPDAPPQQIVNACPACGALSDVTAHEPFTKVTCPVCDTHFRARTAFNHFELIDQIGSGGMSRVFRAQDTSLGRDVALKILNKACSQDRKRAQQFEKEAEITAKISHPNVVRVYTAGRDQGHFYIAMELVGGGSLESYIRDHKKMKESAVLEVAIQAVQGLKAAHDAGLIHRDIKPGNILFAEDGTPKIVDFGLAIFARDADGSGEIWATPYYVPLETLNHAPEDFRSDIYSLGATLFHLLTGKPPCTKDTASLQELKILKAKQIHVKPAVHKLSEETCAMLERALAVQPDGRYKSYDEFLDHLKYAQRRLRRGGKGKPWPGRSSGKTLTPLHWGGIAAGIAAAATGLYFALRDTTPPGPATGTGGSLVTDADPTSGSDNTTTTRFLAARDAMLSGDFGKARQYFEELSNAPGTRQPTRNWARFNTGLAALFMGDNEGARTSYAAIAADGLYSTQSEDADLANFFAGTAKWLSAAEPVSASRKDECAADSVRAIGLLAAGLKNWNAGDARGALEFLRAFDGATPPRSAGWVEACKRLVRNHLADAASIVSLPSSDVGALTAEQADAAVAEARRILEKLTLTGPARDKAAAAVESLTAAVTARKNELMAAAGGDQTQRANNELKLVQETTAACATLGESMRFTDAVAKFEALKITTPESTAARDAHRDTWKKAAEFVEQISRDLARQPVEGVLEDAGGLPVRAALSITGAVLTAKPLQGAEIKLPISKTPPALLAAAGADILGRITDADDFYRRAELLYCFARHTGLKHTAAAWADTLSSELRRFREQQSVLQTVEVVSATGVSTGDK